MSVFKIFSILILSTTYLGIFTLRVFHYGFIYERPSAIIFECIPTVSISFFLILGCAIVEYPILTRFESIIKKGRKDKASITESDVAVCMNCYKRFDIAIAAGDAIGFLLGAGSTAIIESIKGLAPFDSLIFLIIELQSVGIGFLCYTIIVFLVKRIVMTSQMQEIGIQVNANLSRNFNIAIASCVYISIMNMITVPINLLRHPGEGNFGKYLLYCLIGAALDGLICFCTYYLIIRKIQKC